MRKTRGLEEAVAGAQSAEDVLGLLDVWQGRIGDFWRAVAMRSPHWNETLAMGVVNNQHSAVRAAENNALPAYIGEKMAGWLASRLFGDKLGGVRDPAFYALLKLAEREMIHADSTATRIIVERIYGKRPSQAWTNSEFMGARVVAKVDDLESATIRLLLEKLRVRPTASSTTTLQAMFGLHKNAGVDLWRQVVDEAWPVNGRGREERYSYIPEEIAKREDLRADDEIRATILEKALNGLTPRLEPPYPLPKLIRAYAKDGGAKNQVFARWSQENPVLDDATLKARARAMR